MNDPETGSGVKSLRSLAEGQRQLFDLYERAFSVVTGGLDALLCLQDPAAAWELIRGQVIRGLSTSAVDSLNDVTRFMNMNGADILCQAAKLGGIKLAINDLDGPLSVSAIGSMALYADTQLIRGPDWSGSGVLSDGLRKIGRLFDKETDEITMAILNVGRLLQLRPLIDAKLAIPPIVVHPRSGYYSETDLIRGKTWSMDLVRDLLGMEDMNKTVNWVLNTWHDDLENDDSFSPGLPFDFIAFKRITQHLDFLFESDWFNAQPMMCYGRDWHVFSTLASASERELVRTTIMSADTLNVVRSLQHQSVSWLCNVPVSAVPTVLQYQENLTFRKRLTEFTAQLRSANVTNLDQIAREVAYGLSCLVQEYDAASMQLQDKLRAKVASIAPAVGGAFIVGGASAFMPYFSPPASAVAGAIIGGATSMSLLTTALGSYLKERVSMVVEQRRIDRSLVGVLAAANRM